MSLLLNSRSFIFYKILASSHNSDILNVLFGLFIQWHTIYLKICSFNTFCIFQWYSCRTQVNFLKKFSKLISKKKEKTPNLDNVQIDIFSLKKNNVDKNLFPETQNDALGSNLWKKHNLEGMFNLCLLIFFYENADNHLKKTIGFPQMISSKNLLKNYSFHFYKSNLLMISSKISF